MKYRILLKIRSFKEKLYKILSRNPRFYEKFVIIPRKRNYDKNFINITRKEIQKCLEQENYPLPYAIEIETYNKCNGDCDFCPVNVKLDPRKHTKMSDELFYSIIQQLKELNYSNHISLYSNNEPLLDNRIFDFVEYAKKELPNATHFLFSNGLLMNLEKFKKLITNLDYMVIDNYYEGEEKLHKNIKEIAEYCLANEELLKKVKIQVIDKHMLRNNRAGNAKNRKQSYKIKSPCFHPYSQMVIRPTGQLSLCCNDALGQMTMGDLTKETLINAWNSEKYRTLRENMKLQRCPNTLCEKCDSFGPAIINNVLAHYQIGKNWTEISKIMKKEG